MSFDFPNSPTNGQVFAPTGGPVYVYTGGVWRMQSSGQVVTAEARNRIVNPAMQISQENGNTASASTGAMQHFAADQWVANGGTTGTCTQQRVQVPTPNGSASRIRLTVNTADTSLAAGEYQILMQIIEGVRVADFRYGSVVAKQSILRFGWKSPTGTYSVSIRNAAGNRTYLANFTISAAQANVDTEQVLVIPGDTSGTWAIDTGGGIYISFAYATGTTFQGVTGWQAGYFFSTAANTNGLATAGAVYELFDVGLYLDPNATGVPPPWQMPDEADELIACQRYYVKRRFLLVSYAANAAQTSFPIDMRIQPALAIPAIDGGTGATFAFLGNNGFHQSAAHSVPSAATYTASARM